MMWRWRVCASWGTGRVRPLRDGRTSKVSSTPDGMRPNGTPSFSTAHGTLARRFICKSLCRICGIENGYGEFSDGTYLWPTGLAHYVEAHGVRLPAEFVEHATRRLYALEHASVEEGWWRDRTAP